MLAHLAPLQDCVIFTKWLFLTLLQNWLCECNNFLWLTKSFISFMFKAIWQSPSVENIKTIRTFLFSWSFDRRIAKVTVLFCKQIACPFSWRQPILFLQISSQVVTMSEIKFYWRLIRYPASSVHWIVKLLEKGVSLLLMAEGILKIVILFNTECDLNLAMSNFWYKVSRGLKVWQSAQRLSSSAWSGHNVMVARTLEKQETLSKTHLISPLNTAPRDRLSRNQVSFLCATNAECTSCSCSPHYCCLPQLTEIKEYEADWFHDTDHRRPEQLFPSINWSFSGKQIFRASTDWYWLVRTVCYPTTTNRDSVTNITHYKCQTMLLIYEHIHQTQDTVVR